MTNQGLEPEETTATVRRRSAFSGIEQRVLKRLRALELGESPRMVVGFSGGPDSLGLASILDRLARNGHVSPKLVHINHRMRPNADRDAEAVDSLARRYSLPYVRQTLEEDFPIDHPGVGIEEAARRERYLALAQEAIAFDATVIVVGHHQDDQLETVLMHLLRGSGLTGVRGMRKWSRLSIPWWGDATGLGFQIWRPLLGESKASIAATVAETGLTPIIDDSNEDRRFRRNAVRHDVVPAIRGVYPQAAEAVSRFARTAADDDELLNLLANEALSRVISPDGAITVRAFVSEHLALQRRLVAKWLAGHVSSNSITADRIEAVLELASRTEGGKRIEIGEHVSVRFQSGRLVIEADGSTVD